jgi:hypothetical protein
MPILLDRGREATDDPTVQAVGNALSWALVALLAKTLAGPLKE